MPAGYNTPDDTIKKFIELYGTGKSITEISKETNCSQSCVETNLKKNGVKLHGKLPKLNKEQDQKVIELYLSGISTLKIPEYFPQITQCTVSNILKRNNIKTRICYIDLSKEQEEYILNAYELNLSIEDIAMNIGISTSPINRVLDKYNITKKIGNKKYEYDYNAFSGELNEDKEYWIGWNMADGSVKKDKRYYIVKISDRDREHLNKLNKFMKCERPILTYSRKTTNSEEYKNYSELSYNSKQLTKDLEKYGVVPNKTYCAKALNGIEKSKHFWRGMIDGDGSLSITEFDTHYKDKIYHSKTAAMTLTGTFDIVNQFKEHIEKNIIKTKVYIRLAHGCKQTYEAKINGKNVYLASEYLYSSSTIYLDRKYQKYLEIKKLYESKEK